MAFHVSCPITCRRICNCKLGFPPDLRACEPRDEFVKAASTLQALFNDPALIYGKKDENVQVLVPKVGGGSGGGDVAVVVAAEDHAKRFESESGFIKDVRDEQGLSNAKVMCRLCFSAENEGSGRARKMLSCKSCSKKYHSSCVKSWAQNRDLFHWSSWTCPSCRSCEVCQKNGDPNKLMFCKRCDDAYHCYCQQPAHKNVSSGPYLCPKHTKCHSCASTVPGNGISVRWYLGYTCCDACGRLFVKGNYCPVCLKVYRDSESTPMVCCDVCQRWVHCHCDGISDEKYMQFQVDNNLQYRCATCRGECYTVRDLDDAIQELWRRRDKADRELTASLRVAAGLPPQEEIFSVQPCSDDDDDDDRPLAKNEHGRSFKLSLKGKVDKSPKKKSSNKNSVKKKGSNALPFGRTEPLIKSHSKAQSAGFIADNKFKDVDVQSYRSTEFAIAGSLNDAVWSSNQARHHKNSFVKTDRLLRDKMSNGRSHGVDTMEQSGKSAEKSINTKGPKLVIHLGARNKNVTSSPRSDAANLHPGRDLITSNDSEDIQRRANGKHLKRSKLSDIKGDALDHDDQNRLRQRGKEGSSIKIRKMNPEIPDAKPHVLLGKRSETPSVVQEAPGNNKTKELKPLLRLKFKNPYADNQTSLAQSGEDDGSLIKGQRSKRKRPSPLMGDPSFVEEHEGEDDGSLTKGQRSKRKRPFVEEHEGEDDRSLTKGQRSKRKRPSPLMGDPSFVEEHEGADYQSDEDVGDIMDANWIIQKLGKDAIGKKVEIHQRSNRTWHKGTVHEVFEGTSVVSVTLDDGKTSKVDLDKQGIRFYSQKRRW